jgi:hypothetical protein
MTRLGLAAVTLTVLDVLHALDHTRQDRQLAKEVYVVGVSGWVMLGLLLYLVFARHRWAPLYALATGASVLLGFTAVHLAPHWSAFSDPYSRFDPDALSWVLIVLPMLAAAWLAYEGATRLPRAAAALPR